MHQLNGWPGSPAAAEIICVPILSQAIGPGTSNVGGKSVKVRKGLELRPVTTVTGDGASDDPAARMGGLTGNEL